MAESVQTGGLRRFVYERNYSPKVSREEKLEIEDAYAKARERKAREKARRTRNWILLVIILLILVGTLFYFSLR